MAYAQTFDLLLYLKSVWIENLLFYSAVVEIADGWKSSFLVHFGGGRMSGVGGWLVKHVIVDIAINFEDFQRAIQS